MLVLYNASFFSLLSCVFHSIVQKDYFLTIDKDLTNPLCVLSFPNPREFKRRRILLVPSSPNENDFLRRIGVTETKLFVFESSIVLLIFLALIRAFIFESFFLKMILYETHHLCRVSLHLNECFQYFFF